MTMLDRIEHLEQANRELTGAGKNQMLLIGRILDLVDGLVGLHYPTPEARAQAKKTFLEIEELKRMFGSGPDLES